MAIGLNRIKRLFEQGNVCVTGLRGCGKDMLFANVIQRRSLPYLSNSDYGGERYPFCYEDTFKLSGNSYRNFIAGTLHRYVFPYPDRTDIYISDAGVYYPAQEGSFLDRDYKGAPLFMALSRHLTPHGVNVHVNIQNFERCWTKIREQSDIYIRCLWCRVFLGYVVQLVYIYERADSCQLRVPPCPYRAPLLCPPESRQMWEMKRLEYRVAHGDIKPLLLVYRNKSTYDTRAFGAMLAGGDTSA